MLKILLDTHIFLWAFLQPSKLSQSVIDDLLENPAVEKYLSAASSWEIAIKYAKGSLSLPEPPEIFVPKRMRDGGIKRLSITHRHTLHVGQLPPHHKDPFDRLIITQAQLAGLKVLTNDSMFSNYAVRIIRP